MKQVFLAVACSVFLVACVSTPTPSVRNACGDGTVARGGGSGLAQGYTLVFEGFTTDDMLDAEDCFAIFSGYRTHRLTYTSRTLSEIWYETTSGSAQLLTDLNEMFGRLHISTRTSFSGNEYTISKIKRRKSRE